MASIKEKEAVKELARRIGYAIGRDSEVTIRGNGCNASECVDLILEVASIIGAGKEVKAALDDGSESGERDSYAEDY